MGKELYYFIDCNQKAQSHLCQFLSLNSEEISNSNHYFRVFISKNCIVIVIISGIINLIRKYFD